MAPLPLVVLTTASMVFNADILLRVSCPMVRTAFEYESDFCSGHDDHADAAVNLDTITFAPLTGNVNVHVGAGAGTVKPTLGHCVMQSLMSLIVGALLAKVFKTRVTDKKVSDSTPMPNDVNQIDEKFRLSNGKDWEYGTFDCFGDINYCMHGCFCYPCMTADLFAANGLSESFFVVWFVVYLPSILSPLVGLLPVYGQSIPFIIQIFVAAMLANFTGELRKKLGGTPNLPQDLVCWFCCACCNVIQKQRQVDAIKQDRMECVCNVVKAREVGQIVSVTEPLLTA